MKFYCFPFIHGCWCAVCTACALCVSCILFYLYFIKICSIRNARFRCFNFVFRLQSALLPKIVSNGVSKVQHVPSNTVLLFFREFPLNAFSHHDQLAFFVRVRMQLFFSRTNLFEIVNACVDDSVHCFTFCNRIHLFIIN